VHSMYTCMPQWDPVLLQRADHLEPGAVAHVRETRVTCDAEMRCRECGLRVRSKEPPLLELLDAVGASIGERLSHPPTGSGTAASSCRGKCTFQLSFGLDVSRARRRTPPSPMTVCGLAEERLAHQGHVAPCAAGLDRSATRPAGADDKNVVPWLVLSHQKPQSVRAARDIRYVESVNPTEKRLVRPSEGTVAFR